METLLVPIERWGSSHYRDLFWITYTLWPDIAVSKNILQEAVAALSLKADRPASFNEVIFFLLKKRKDPSFNFREPRQTDPFWHLHYDERFILIGLHNLKWHTAHLSHLLGLSPIRIEALAWISRLEIGPKHLYPLPPLKKTPTCPPYDLKHPWTQRFLDPKPPHDGHHFTLEQHLCECKGCKEALDRCRTFYFHIQKQLERLMPSEPGKSEWERLKDQIEKRPTWEGKRSLPFWKGIRQFLSQWDTRALLVAFFVISILKYLGYLI